jgi:hypothetical protein
MKSTNEFKTEKPSTRTRSYDTESIRTMVHQNKAVDYVILLSLYQHRLLTSEQLYRIGHFQSHINSLRNRLRTLAERKVLNVQSRFGIRKQPIRTYSLASLGLRILIEDILQVKEYVSELDEYKEHYTLDDLRVRGQFDHFYEIQEWLSIFLLKEKSIFHCEWRRFPIFDEEENIPYRPDWVIFERNEKEEVVSSQLSQNPLLYPYFYRNEIFDDLDLTLKPLVSVECDRGTMSRADLVEKWGTYKKDRLNMISDALVMFYPKDVNGTTRHRNIRETMLHSFEYEIIDGKIDLFQGARESTAEAVSLFINRNGNILLGEPMMDKTNFEHLINSYRQSVSKSVAYIETSDENIKRLQLPVKPDHIVIADEERDEIQLVFYGITNWLNPIGKIRTLEKWIKDGGLSIFQDIKIVLMYPNQHSIESDISYISNFLFYVSFEDIQEEKCWGSAWKEERKHNRVFWKETRL